LGFINSKEGDKIKVDESFITTASVLYDAVFLPDGEDSINELLQEADAMHFVEQAYKHCKAIGANGAGEKFLKISAVGSKLNQSDQNRALKQGVIVNQNAFEFIKAIAQHRFWEREIPGKIPA
jgi:catalase